MKILTILTVWRLLIRNHPQATASQVKAAKTFIKVFEIKISIDVFGKFSLCSN